MKLNKDFTASLFLAVFTVVLTLYSFRPIFSGQLIGDSFDSRLMIVIHEHWWRWFNGLTEFRDLGFFYPYDSTLGFSDVFLIPGVIYSFFRALNFGLAESWTIVTFIVLIFGNLGWVIIAKRFLNNVLMRILFLATIITSFSFTAYFAINPNIVGYSLLSWFVFLIYSIEEEKDIIIKQRKIAIFIILFLIYSLSYWYGAFFLGFLVLIRLLAGLIYRNKNIDYSRSFFQIKTPDGIWLIAIPIIVFFIWLFYYVYISVASEPFRSKSEMILNSPNISMLLNGGSPTQYGLKNFIFGPIYQFLGLDLPFENLIGLGVAVTLLGLISFSFVMLRGERLSRIWLLSLIFSFLYFVKIFNNISLHSYLFDIVPGLNSIRYPARFVIILSYALIFISFKFLDDFFGARENNIKKFFLYSIAILLFLDQIRGSFTGWNENILKNKNLFSQAEEIKNNCDYFYLDHPGGWWYDQIEAITFSAQVGIPTVNGYSGAFPRGYPVQSWNSIFGSKKIFAWMSTINASKKGCFLSGISDYKSLDEDEVFFDFIGFTPREKIGSNYWNWAVNKKPYLYVFSSKAKKVSVVFEIETSPCFKTQDITLENAASGQVIEKVKVTNGKEIGLEINFEDSYLNQIIFTTDADVCKVEGDPRGLYFNVKNIVYQKLS